METTMATTAVTMGKHAVCTLGRSSPARDWHTDALLDEDWALSMLIAAYDHELWDAPGQPCLDALLQFNAARFRILATVIPMRLEAYRIVM